MARVSVWYIRAALLHFFVGVTLGAWQLAATGGLLPEAPVMLRSVHVEVVLLGWLVQLAAGVASWILPFSGAVSEDRRFWGAWWALNGGILFVLAGACTDTALLFLLGRGGELVAGLLLVWGLWARLRPLPRWTHA